MRLGRSGPRERTSRTLTHTLTHGHHALSKRAHPSARSLVHSHRSARVPGSTRLRAAGPSHSQSRRGLFQRAPATRPARTRTHVRRRTRARKLAGFGQNAWVRACARARLCGRAGVLLCHRRAQDFKTRPTSYPAHATSLGSSLSVFGIQLLTRKGSPLQGLLKALPSLARTRPRTPARAGLRQLQVHQQRLG